MLTDSHGPRLPAFGLEFSVRDKGMAQALPLYLGLHWLLLRLLPGFLHIP